MPPPRVNRRRAPSPIRPHRQDPRELTLQVPEVSGFVLYGGRRGLIAALRWTLAEIAVIIGGSGFYRFLEDASEISVETPFGPPSGPLTIGAVGGRSVAFLPRHGPRHQFPPHRINARANLWALRHLGVTRVIGPCASGSLRPEVGPGDLVILDQLLDRTWGRQDTFLDGPEVEHVSFADPYCPEIRQALISASAVAGAWTGGKVHGTGTVVVVQGPRFSTRAESKWLPCRSSVVGSCIWKKCTSRPSSPGS